MMRLAILLSLFLAVIASAADRVRYVDTGSSGGNGTTNAISGANAAYVSLSACLTAEHTADSTITDEGNLVIHCNRTNGGGADTTTATVVSTWVTDATHYISIVQDDFPATGAYNATKYVLQATDASALTIQDKYVRVGPLQFNPIQTSTGIARGINLNTIGASEIHIRRCVFKGTCSGTGEGYGIYMNDASSTATVYNCVFLDIVSGTDADFRAVRLNCSAANVYNCTFYNCRYDITQSAGTVNVLNCALHATAAGNNFLGTFNAIDSCCSDDGDGTNAVAPSGGDWANEFNNIAGGDFSLKVGANSINAGDGTTPKSVFTTDLIGTARGPADGDWDIGAYEVAAPGGNGRMVFDGNPLFGGIVR